MSAQPDSNTALLNKWEHDQAQSLVELEQKQRERNTLMCENRLVFEEDHKYFLNELAPLEKDELLDQILFIMSNTPQKDRESEISDELWSKMSAVAKRMAEQGRSVE